MTDAERLAGLPTPGLVLDEARMRRNLARLRAHLAPHGVALRPHMKTAKSLDVAAQALEGAATVSTLREAEVLAGAGVRDILYAVGIAPDKLPRALALRRAGCDLTLLLDSPAQARAVAAAAREAGDRIPALIEIDCDGHRGGLHPDDPALIETGRLLHQGGAALRGVMAHAGESYAAAGPEAQAAFAERERVAATAAANALRAAGLPCEVVSIGSTPTAHAARNLAGVTEVRAGVYMFFDLFMAGIGVCRTEDIALSVLATVIGHQRARGWILLDAGWMALSRDRGTANQAVDQGYGLVCDEEGRPYPDLIVGTTNQEHGIAALRPGSTATLPDLPVGARVRILPNHACATAAQYPGYAVLREAGGAPETWPRFGGW